MKKDKSKVVEVTMGKDEISWVQKQYDEKGRLYAFDFMLPNLTLVSLDLWDSFGFINMIIEKGPKWANELNEIGEELSRLEKEEEKRKEKKAKNYVG